MSEIERMAEHAEDAARLLKGLSHKSRLMICCVLADRELSVGELNKLVPLSQSALSQHLALMREQQLLASRRDGQAVFYRLASDAALKVVMTLRDIFCPDEF